MVDLDALKQLHDDAEYERIELQNRRRERERELRQAADVSIRRTIDEEFGADLARVRANEIARKTALDDAKIAEQRQRLSKTNYGVVVEWERHDQNWYNPERKHWLYPKRRAVLEICTPESKFPDNRQYGLPQPGEVFLRILTKNREPGRKFVKLFNREEETPILPAGWYPEGDIPEKAAPQDYW